MRPAVVIGVPILLLLSGSVYFIARPKEDDRIRLLAAKLRQSATPALDDADAADTAAVRTFLGAKLLTEEQTDVLIQAAGRRYVRRRVAFEEARQAVAAGRAPASGLVPLRQNMEMARKVCDVAESLGRHGSELREMASVEAQLGRMLTYSPSAMLKMGLTDRFIGTDTFSDADLKSLDEAFQARFRRPLPVSARGESAAHRALGFDHRGRVDVAVSPMQPEGVWLRGYLSAKGITFFAFSSAVRGKATGAHIHIGGASGRAGHTN